MRENFTINQDLSLLEFYRIQIYLTVRYGRLRRIYILILGMPILITLFDLLTNIVKWQETIIRLIMVFIFLLLFFFVVTFILSWIMMITKSFLFKNSTYEFNHEGMIKKTIKAEFTVPWRSLHKLKETKKFILLYVSENDIHILQKRMFADNKEMEEFKKFADQNIWG